MDVAHHVAEDGEVWSTAVRLRPDWKRRLLIIVAAMAAICVGSAAGVVLGEVDPIRSDGVAASGGGRLGRHAHVARAVFAVRLSVVDGVRLLAPGGGWLARDAGPRPVREAEGAARVAADLEALARRTRRPLTTSTWFPDDKAVGVDVEGAIDARQLAVDGRRPAV